MALCRELSKDTRLTSSSDRAGMLDRRMWAERLLRPGPAQVEAGHGKNLIGTWLAMLRGGCTGLLRLRRTHERRSRESGRAKVMAAALGRRAEGGGTCYVAFRRDGLPSILPVASLSFHSLSIAAAAAAAHIRRFHSKNLHSDIENYKRQKEHTRNNIHNRNQDDG